MTDTSKFAGKNKQIQANSEPLPDAHRRARSAKNVMLSRIWSRLVGHTAPAQAAVPESSGDRAVRRMQTIATMPGLDETQRHTALDHYVRSGAGASGTPASSGAARTLLPTLSAQGTAPAVRRRVRAAGTGRRGPGRLWADAAGPYESRAVAQRHIKATYEDVTQEDSGTGTYSTYRCQRHVGCGFCVQAWRLPDGQVCILAGIPSSTWLRRFGLQRSAASRRSAESISRCEPRAFQPPPLPNFRYHTVG